MGLGALLLALGPALVAETRAAAGWWARLGAQSPEGGAVTPAGHWLVIIFISPECPLANADIPVINALAKEYAQRGFGFVGIYSDPLIAPEVLQRHALEYSLTFPVVDDRRQVMARMLGARYTPEVFVCRPDGTCVYRGRIDDRVGDFGEARPSATRQDLREVLAALAAGQAGPFPDRPGFGCAIPQPLK